MMEHKINGRIWLFGDDINTDLMYPYICYSQPEEKKQLFTMWANRPEWSKLVRKGDIIIAGKNFGIGSSRPAASNLKALGLSCVVAESINGLFFRNSVNIGLPAVSCKGISQLAREGDSLDIDLDKGIVKTKDGRTLSFSPLPGFLTEIIDSGGIIEILKRKGCLENDLR